MGSRDLGCDYPCAVMSLSRSLELIHDVTFASWRSSAFNSPGGSRVPTSPTPALSQENSPPERKQPESKENSPPAPLSL